MARSRRRRAVKMPGVSTKLHLGLVLDGDATHEEAGRLNLLGDDGDPNLTRRLTNVDFPATRAPAAGEQIWLRVAASPRARRRETKSGGLFGGANRTGLGDDRVRAIDRDFQRERSGMGPGQRAPSTR